MPNYNVLSKKFRPVRRKNDIDVGELIWLETPDISDPHGYNSKLEGPYLVIKVNRGVRLEADTIVYIESKSGDNKSCYCDWAYRLA